MEFTLAEVADAVDGEVVRGDPTTRVAGVSIDSRSVAAGELFVPIVAARDGHEFVEDAIRAGAAAHLTSTEVAAGPAVRVADTAIALSDLGRWARGRLRGEVIGITGSVGKTTTKDFAAAALGAVGSTHASVRSFNNELGVPLTLANAPEAADHVVLEMGARGVGHIAELCAVAGPTIGAVLAVGAAHTELLGDLDGVALAKGELVEALPPTGTAILNADDHRVAAMAARTPAQVLTYGDAGEIRAVGVELDPELRPRFTVETPWGRAPVALPSAGLHAVPNALAAIAIGLAGGGDLAALVVGLAEAEVSPWRMEVVRTPSGATIINDAYNANPMSMHAAIDALERLPAQRRVAVIGVMAELGAEGDAEHVAVGERLARAGVEVVSVGVPAYGGTVVSSVAEVPAILTPLETDTAVLVKGSRVAGLERLMALLGLVEVDR